MTQDDPVPGMPELHRQERSLPLDASGRPLIPSRVPETRPTPLVGSFIYVSLVALVGGALAITALELGAHLSDPVVRISALAAAVALAIVTVDAMVRIWRSAWAWMPVDRGQGLFRLVWTGTLVAVLGVISLAAWIVLQA